MVDLVTVATQLSILGAVLNGTGIAFEHKKLMFGSQLTWVFSNALWLLVYASASQPRQLYTFMAFFITAAFSVVVLIYRNKRGFKDGKSR